jgi:hypothetical protein
MLLPLFVSCQRCSFARACGLRLCVSTFTDLRAWLDRRLAAFKRSHAVDPSWLAAFELAFGVAF